MAKRKTSSLSRRNFLKTAGAFGAGSMLPPLNSLTAARTQFESTATRSNAVPIRPFGKTDVDVPILGLGEAFGCTSNLLLNQAIKMGVCLWDTAAAYAGGNSERAIGKYFSQFPADRPKIFLVTKSSATCANLWSKDLAKSLERMNTSYVDLFLIQLVCEAENLGSPAENAELWAAKAKSEKKIRFFGFSTHKHMEKNLVHASKLDWIDGIMFSYNFRVMRSANMQAAVDACTKAGIGLIAIKTQAARWYGQSNKDALDANEKALLNQLLKKGLTIEQAKLKAVWDDRRIASIASIMKNMTILQANVAAAADNRKLSMRDKQLLDQYARRTAAFYCAGCASICEAEINNEVPISDVMRFLMYARCYGDLAGAKTQFNDLSSNARERMAYIDYKKAEQKCPQGMHIGRLMQEAATELA